MNVKVKIAIIDSGINRKLAENINCENALIVDESKTCRQDDVEPQTTDYIHGTICSLIIETYCPKCVFSSIRILDHEGKGDIDKIEPALEWCSQNDIKIVNLSLGTTHFKDNDKLNKVINKYANKGLIIVAAVSNIGYVTFPASFTNVIGAATVDSPLLYANDDIHLGIDTVVPSVHTIMLGNKEHKTSLSNSYAAPYVSALAAKKIMTDENCDIHTLKKYVREKSHMAMAGDVYNPDWIDRAYIKNKSSESKENYYFETITGSYENCEHEVDTIIISSKTELEQIDIGNKNLIYLGNEDIEDVHISGFKWSWQTKVQQIVYNQYRGMGLSVPLIILNIPESFDKYSILATFRKCFEKDRYHPYIISGEPESILYKFEYIPDIHIHLTNRSVKDFIEGQVFYKQVDIILWNIGKKQNTDIDNLYPDYEMKIVFDNKEVFVYIDKKLCYQHNNNDLSEACIKDIYKILVNCLTAGEDGEIPQSK